MTPQAAPAAAVKRTLTIGAPIESAFRTLTEKMGTWWPATHHIAKTPFAEVVVEPRAGGRWFERDATGAECDWGRVLVWEPPKRLVVSWHLQGDFTYDPDITRASEVVFDFIAEGQEMTRLEFEHRHIERHAENAELVRSAVDSPGGWTCVLGQYQRSLGGATAGSTLTAEERGHAVGKLESAHAAFLGATKGLSAAQWKFKPTADRWSVAECAEHVAVVQELVLGRIHETALKGPANPEKRKSIKFTDCAIYLAGCERASKLNAPELIRPSGRWNAPAEILENLAALGERTVAFVKTTQDDLRNHYMDHPVFGTLDIYQWVLLLSAHMQRHTAQILEVKADPNFPKR